jgi:hypothetical protein
MIEPREILKNHIVKVLVKDDDETEYYATVLSNEGEYIFVSYFVPIGKNYKTAPVHSFESKAERVDFDSLTEHHFVSDEINVKKVGKNMFVFIDEIDSESDSEIETEDDDDDDDSGGSLNDFIVSDEHISPSCGDTELDDQWDKWSPKTDSAKRFKKTVDNLEAIAKIEEDNLEFKKIN